MSAAAGILRQPTLADLEGLGRSYERSPWVPPSIATAKEYRKHHSFAGGRAPLWGTSADDIATASVGSAMLLRSLQALMCMFILMAAVTTPSIAIFWAGSRVPAHLPDPLRFAHLSLGNAGPLALDELQALTVADNATSSNFPAALGSGTWSKIADGTALASRFFVHLEGSDLTGEQAAWLVGSLDAVACFLALVMYCVCSRRLRIMSSMDHQRRISAGDFTVMVTGLPPDATKQEVIAHFGELFALDGTGVVDMFGVCRLPSDPASAQPLATLPSSTTAPPQAATATAKAAAGAGAGAGSASDMIATAVGVDDTGPETPQVQDADQQPPAREEAADDAAPEAQQPEEQQQSPPPPPLLEAGEQQPVQDLAGADQLAVEAAAAGAASGAAVAGDAGLPAALATADIAQAISTDNSLSTAPFAASTLVDEGGDAAGVRDTTGASTGNADQPQLPQPAAASVATDAAAAATPAVPSGPMSSPPPADIRSPASLSPLAAAGSTTTEQSPPGDEALEDGEQHTVHSHGDDDVPELVVAEAHGPAAGVDELPTAIATADIAHAAGTDGRLSTNPIAMPTTIHVEDCDPTAAATFASVLTDPLIELSQPPQIAAGAAGAAAAEAEAAAALEPSDPMSSPVHIFAPPPRRPAARRDGQAPPTAHALPPKPLTPAQISSAVRSRLSKGIVTDADPHLTMAHPLDVYAAMDGGRVADDAGAAEELVGGWLVDVVLVPKDMTPAVAALRAATTVQALRQARADFKMHRSGASSRKDPNLKQQAATLRRIEKLEHSLSKTVASLAAHHAVRHGTDASPADSHGDGKCSGRTDTPGAGIAFVTFNAEESLQRCLMAYSGSGSWFRHLWQNPLLRFRRPPPEVARNVRGMLCCQGRRLGYTLQVVQAPEPLDIKHENLGAPAATRCCLRLLTALTTLVLVLIGFAGMVGSQSYSQAVSAQLPDLTLCNTHIPAAFLGGYSNVTAVSEALSAGYGGVVVDSTGYVAGGTNFSDSYNLLRFSAPTPQLVRPEASDERAMADASCGVTKFSVVYRYDFTGIPPSDYAAYTGVPIVNTTSITKQAAVGQPSSRYYVGTAVPYGNITQACSSSVLQALIDTADGQVPVTHPACPDPRKVGITPALDHCQCIESTSSSTCYTLPCYASADAWRHATSAKQAGNTPAEQACIAYPVSTLAGCYCVQSLDRKIATHGAVAGFMSFASSEKDVCTDFANVYIAAQVTVIATAASASIINVALGLIIPWLNSLEKHISVSDEQSALIMKVAIAQLINTMFTVLLVNAKLPASVSLPSVLASVGLLNGVHRDFQTAWYATIGSSICLSVLINITVALVTKLITFIRFWFQMRKANRGALQVATQEQLNDALCGPPMNLTATYPALIITLFSCTVYSAGMPLLHWFGFGAMVLSYAMDKLLLLRYYRLSPNAATWPAHALIGIIPVAIFLHVCFGVWMLGGDAILWPATYASVAWGSLQASANRWMLWMLSLARDDPLRVAARLWLAHTFPTLTVLLLIVAVAVLRMLAVPAGVVLRRIWAAIVKSAESKTEQAAASLRCLSGVAPSRLRSTMLRNALSSPPSAFGSEPRGVAAHTPLLGITPTDIMPSYLWRALARLPAVTRGLQVQGAALRALRKRGATRAQGVTIGHGKGLSPWTSDFFRIYDPAFGKTLSGAQQLQGWRLQELDAQSWMDVHAEKAATQYAQLEAAGVNLKAVVGGTQAAKQALAYGQPTPPRQRRGASDRAMPVTPSELTTPSEKTVHSTVSHTGVDDALISVHSGDGHDAGGFGPAVSSPGDGAVAPVVADTSGSNSGGDAQPEFPHVYILRNFHGMDAELPEGKLLPKRTWEVIADAGLTSYDYRKHPAYQAARILAAEQEQERLSDSTSEPSGEATSVARQGSHRHASIAVQGGDGTDGGSQTLAQKDRAPGAGTEDC